MVALLQDLETQTGLKPVNERIYSLQIIGYSYLGNPIYAVKFSDNPGTEEDSEPDIVIDPGLHGNEWLPMESNINFIQYLFDVYYDDQHADYAEVQDLANNFDDFLRAHQL